MTLEWTRSDLNTFVFVWRSGQDFVKQKSPSYKGRTSLFIEELKHGNISLKLSKVTLSDKGIYSCYIQELEKRSFVELVVASDAASSPVISLAGVDRDRGGVVLQCESKGWYPQPEVFWLDGEGNLLSAGPTETVRGPDDLYTVSSRVTVEKRHNNNFTCRVQQNDINQIRETHIIVPDDFFKVKSSSSPVTVGLAVGLAGCIVLIVAAAVVFFGWKWRQNKIKTKRSHRDETDGGGRNATEMQRLNEEGTDGDTAQSEGDEGAAARSSISQCNWQIIKKQTLQDQQNKVQTLMEELETKMQELDKKQDELLKEKQNREKAESEVTKLENQLESRAKGD
ncbi:butyrophilin subfamily 2 member A1-like [Thunnus maccoyii]|uniref:butyrophilin subfamily 2 member A1-like n=1 Tax=Thunnus maccoyii TaxID=8240 RepID=UPI001C4B4E03|nr:butyrophilin subfamily 2 member A1-like [Thunnus maccoyii]